jgi:hypothetical protein
MQTTPVLMDDFDLCAQKNLRDAMLQATAEIEACNIIATANGSSSTKHLAIIPTASKDARANQRAGKASRAELFARLDCICDIFDSF